MAWNGSGGHDRVHNWVADRNAAINITASRMDAEFDDVSTALENCVTRDGQNSPSANLPMNNLHHTGVSNATGLTQYAAADQVVKGTLLHAATASAAGTDTYLVSLAISPGAYSRGQVFSFIPDVANTGACSVNFNSIGAGNIKLINGNDPYDGAIQISKDVVVRYDGTNFILMNPYNFTDLAGIVVSTAAEINTLALSGVTNADLVKLHAVTSTAAELSKLAGTPAGLTATEIGYLDGVTSALQTQIDSKVNASAVSAFGFTLIDDADAATALTTLGLTTTAAEINIIDGDTAATATTIVDADRVVLNDAGIMKQVAVTDVDTYISATAKTLTNKTLTSPVLNGSLSGTAIGRDALVYNSGSISVPNITNTVITFDSEDHDTDNIHDTVTNNSRLTVPSGVIKIKLSLKIEFLTNSTGNREVYVRKNNLTTYTGFMYATQIPITSTSTTTFSSICMTSPPLDVIAGDYFEVFAFQNSGGAINVKGGNSGSWFSMEIIK